MPLGAVGAAGVIAAAVLDLVDLNAHRTAVQQFCSHAVKCVDAKAAEAREAVEVLAVAATVAEKGVVVLEAVATATFPTRP